MASVHAILRKKTNKLGHYPIAIRVTQNRKKVIISLGQHIEAKYWDEARMSVKKSHPNSVRLNSLITAKMSQANDTVLEAIRRFGDNFTSADFKSLLNTIKSGTSFYNYAEQYLNELEEAKKYTRVNSERPLLNKIKKLRNGKDFSIDDVTVSFLRKLSVKLKHDGSIGGRSIANVFMFIRTLYNRAIDDKMAKRELYPFGDAKDKFRIVIPDSVKIGLTIEEVTAIENLNLPHLSPRDHARNVWLFSFYLAGMRVADVLKIKWSSVRDNRLYYQMDKNDKPLSLKVTGKLKTILDKYDPKGDPSRTFIFPELDDVDSEDAKLVLKHVRNANHKFNKHLKKIAQTCEINVPLSMHIARHTFGNISGNKIPIRTLQKLYRHSNITTTINYQQNFVHDEMDDALDKVINF
ncbi:MAG: site-specific integrase [Flavobacteriaceae bacterium]|nr:site-specific integrase [Flavobacteriaceae bacterium]